MSGDWDKTIKDDFQKAQDGYVSPFKEEAASTGRIIETKNGGHDKIGDGPRPPVEGRPAPKVSLAPGPGGPSSSVHAEWEALDREARGEGTLVSQQFHKRSADRGAVDLGVDEYDRGFADTSRRGAQPGKNPSLTREFDSKAR